MADRQPRQSAGAGFAAGGIAGLLVGLADGVRAAAAVGAGVRIAVTTALLTAGVDAVVGALAGAAAELLIRLALWGRGARRPPWADLLSLAVAAAGAAGAAAAVVIATADRHNRFLAAGLTSLAGASAAVGAAVLAPALARTMGGRASERRPMSAPGTAPVLFGPLLMLVAAGAAFAAVGHSRAPLTGRALVERSASAAVAAAALPFCFAVLARLRLPLRWRWAAAFSIAVYGTAAALAIAAAWTDNLRFAPWAEILVGASIVVLGLPVAAALWRLSWRPLFACGVVTLSAGVVATFRASEVEPARKAASAHAAWVGPILALGRRALDFDGDGFARALGGGDCDDRDPDVHPGALDLPGDGIDADCDGQDATDPLPPPATMVDLPATIPANLNLLLVTIDTLRADHLGCYGYGRPTSPAIDRLAAEATLFENGWAHAPSTRYSMPAIATGRWPSAIAWDESIWWPRIAPGMRTTAEALHDAGYFTAGMFSFSYFAIADHRGFERGMDLYRSDRAVLHVAVNGPMESRGSSSREMTDDAMAFVDAHRDRRFFLWLHYYDPHLSYERHPEVPSFGDARVDLYDGEIRFTDLHFGRLLDHLRENGLWERTVIVLTGDHGEGFGEHGVTEHGFDLYTAQTKVPFIVRVPGVPPRRVRAPAGHIDIAPTLLNLARGHAEPGFIGRSLVPDILGPPAADTDTRAVFQEVTSERGKKRALVTTTRHLIWNATPGDTTECYDRAADPGERRDIWDAAGDAACIRLAGNLKRLVAGLALPPGAAAKLSAGVTPPGVAAPTPSHPVDASLGDAIAVRGYDASATAVRAGQAVEETTYFAVKARIEGGWRLLFHLEGPSTFRNLDHVPIDGLMPLERWRPGQQIRDRLTITVPAGSPAGVYTLFVGAFRRGVRMRAAPPVATDGRDRIRLLQLTVLP
jgi:arylsulfatase A-like enzyme